jgi:hypothetical protein
MKIKKEVTKKVVKKTAAKVKTLSAAKKVVKKTKTASVAKKTNKIVKTIAAPKLAQGKSFTDLSDAALRKRAKHIIKRSTYMLLALIVGILSAGFVIGLLEKIYIENSFKMGATPMTHQFLGMNLFLLPIAYILIFAAGLIFGTWLGFWGWRVVYIERRHRMFQK